MFLQLCLLPRLGHKKAIGILGYPIASKLEDQLAFGHSSVHTQTTDFIIQILKLVVFLMIRLLRSMQTPTPCVESENQLLVACLFTVQYGRQVTFAFEEICPSLNAEGRTRFNYLTANDANFYLSVKLSVAVYLLVIKRKYSLAQIAKSSNQEDETTKDFYIL